MRETSKVSEENSLSIRLLGSPEASLWGRHLRFPTKKALALLCYLASERRKHSRGALAELFWPQSNERRARIDLRSTLARLRKVLGENGTRGDGGSEGVRLLTVDGDLLGVDQRGIELDLRTLEAAVSLARSETSETPLEGSKGHDAIGGLNLIDRLEGTLGAYRGEFMEGFSLEDAPEFELWLEAERGRWRVLFGELCERLSRLQSEAGGLEEAMRTTRLWTSHAPLEEVAHRRLVELLSAAGDSEGALLAYRNFRGALSKELGTEPSPRLAELAENLREEVEERATLGTSLAHSATASPLLTFEVPFAGRQREFGTLVSEYYACASGEEPRIVTISGEAGIGKTRLAKEFLSWAKARGADILEGAASEGTGLPYGPLVEAIRSRMERERAPDDLLEDAWLSELSRLLPELKERYPDLPSASSGEGGTTKGALFEAIARTVGALALRAPVVLFLDDLQWADATTLEVLEYAGRRWAEQGAHVLVVIAARPEDTVGSVGFEGWLSSLGRRLPVRSLILLPLGGNDVKVLLRRLTNTTAQPCGDSREPAEANGKRYGLESFGDWLAIETGGQPFYLVETLKTLLEEEKLALRSAPDGKSTLLEVGTALWAENSSRRVLSDLLPRGVREVIKGRLSLLSSAASELLAAGAVLGRGFGFVPLLRVAGLEEAEGLRGLDELIGRRLLLEKDDCGEQGRLLYRGATYSFSHEKIRKVAYTEAGEARRSVLHRRALEVLEEGAAPPVELARHALGAGLAEAAFGYSVAAGNVAMEVFAPRDAIMHYERARNLLAEEVRTGSARQLVEPSIPDLEHLYTQLGRAYELAKEWGKAGAAYEVLLALGRELGEARLEVMALNLQAILIFHQQDTDPPTVRGLLEEAKRVAEEADFKEALLESECNLADFMSFWAEEFEYSRPPAEKALASARVLGERPDLIARVLWTLARLEMFAGRLEESAAYAEEGATLSRGLAERPAPRTHLPSMLVGVMGLAASWRAGTKGIEIRCLNFLSYDRILQGRLREGIKIGREALDKSRELQERAEAMGSWSLSLGLVEIGEYEEGLELCRRGTELARKTQNALLLWYNLNHLGRAHEALLDLEKARRVYEEALQLRGPLGPRYHVLSYFRLCAVAALSEDWQEAYAHALRVHEGRTSFDVLDGFYLHHEVEALLQGGDERLARESMHRFAERAEGNKRNRISYLRSLAVLDEWEGNTRMAIDYLHGAQTLAKKIGFPGELWQIQSRIGELHKQRGEDGQAREAFSGVVQTMRMLAQKIRDEELRGSFLSAPQVRRVLEHD